MNKMRLPSWVFVLSLTWPAVGVAQTSTDTAQTDPAAAPADPGAAEAPPAEPPTATSEETETAAPVATPPVETASQPEPNTPSESVTELQTEEVYSEDVENLGETEETTAAEDAGEDEGEKLPWRNSLFIWDQSINTYAFDESAGISYDPTYAWAFSFRPRWYLNDTVFIRVREDLDYELTDSDTTTYNRQAMFSDMSIDVAKSKLVDVAGYTLQAGARVTLPLSIASQANNVYMGTGIFANSAYEVEGVLEGLSFTLDTSYSHSWAGSNVALLDTSGDVNCTLASGDPNNPGHGSTECGGGSTNISDSFVLALGGSLSPIEKMSIDLGFTWWWRRARDLGDAVVPVDSAEGGTVTIEDESTTHWRNLMEFAASVGYDVVDGLNLSLGYSAYTTQVDPDGTLRNPFYNSDSVVSFTAQATLDQLYLFIRGDEEQHTASSDPQPNSNQAQAAANAPQVAW